MEDESQGSWVGCILVIVVVVLALLCAMLFRLENKGAMASTFNTSPLPPPPCYCQAVLFESCVNSDGCWLGQVGEGNWVPWGTFVSPLQYPYRKTYLPLSLRGE